MRVFVESDTPFLPATAGNGRRVREMVGTIMPRSG
jgi:hypothetical protein